MNLALPALIAFLVLLPGFVFRSGLKRTESESLDFSPFGRVAAEGVLFSLILHAVWLSISSLVGFRLDPLTLMNLLSAHAATQARGNVQIASQFGAISAYFSSLLVASHVVPALIRRAISTFKLDRIDTVAGSVFRFHDAPWYYLLTGADFEKQDEPDLIYVSAIVEVGKEAVLYVGVLNNFYFDKEGQLDRLILQRVKRRPMSADKSVDGQDIERFYPVDGDSFVLRYFEAITLNIQYVKLTANEVGTVA
jgi:hypothetical protein